MTTKQATVIFQPSGRRGQVPLGISLLEASRRLGADIEALCGEQKICGKCKVRIETGRFEKYGITSGPENAGPWQDGEGQSISLEDRAAGLRLACTATVQGDLLIHVPEESRAGKQVVSKAPRPIAIDLDPAVRTLAVTVPAASMQNQTADLERLCQILKTDHGLNDLRIDLPALRALSTALRADRGKVTVSLWQDREIIRVRHGNATTCFGMAIDIGTTTIAGYLCDLRTGDVVATASMMNPQVKFGEDVMSRITYHMNHADGLQQMRAVLVDGLNRLVENALAEASEIDGLSLEPEDIEDVAVCGNTTMQHILCQLDPEALGVIPFTPAHHRSLTIKARDLGIRVHPAANLFVLPNPAGFVGGDCMGVILAVAPHQSNQLQLIIDIGTNGELVLGSSKRLLATSCATGPALEGAQIEFGMRAAPGAIERVKIDPGTYRIDYKVVGRDAWRSYSRPEQMQTRGICGSGILDVLAELYRAGIVLKSGAFNAGHPSERLRKNEQTDIWEFVLAPSVETSIGRDVVITQIDIRQIQLAKAAIYTGCKIMLRRLKAERPDCVKIAGAFGNHVDRTLALVTGLFPDCAVECVSAVGNAAGDGCRAALLDRKKRLEADRIVGQVEYVELTGEEDFQMLLMEATQIPHMTDLFPNLINLVPPEILNQ